MKIPPSLPQTRILVYHADERSQEAYDALKVLVESGHKELLALHSSQGPAVWNEHVKALDVHVDLGLCTVDLIDVRTRVSTLEACGYDWEIGQIDDQTNGLVWDGTPKTGRGLLTKTTFVSADFDFN